MTFSGRRASQDKHELATFLEFVKMRRFTSYLEIGARHGDTFHDVMMAMPKGSIGVAVDLGGGPWGSPKSVPFLHSAIDDLRKRGYLVKAIFGDSRSAGIRQMAMLNSPYDLCLIDGDHRYEGVKADWFNYRKLAKVIAFHDIVGDGEKDSAGNMVEVPRLWNELKADYAHIEIVAPVSTMGIGIIDQ